VSGPRSTPPSNLNHLQSLISKIASERGREVKRVQRAVANTIVGQMLPPGVVKGGTAMKLRVGEAGSRFTPDLDASRSHAISLDDYLDQLAERLAAGWHGFTGAITPGRVPQPKGVPDDYIMKPFDIRLSYKFKTWLTVTFELGRDEVGSTVTFESRMASDIAEIFASLGFPQPDPIPVLALDHQIAQKLHACTSIDPKTGENERAHDLVDLQILEQEEMIDLAASGVTARRLFVSRGRQAWPPAVRAYSRWDTVYAEAADGLGVLGTIDEAVEWANAFVALIDTASS
jgi:hypothetical protein